MNAYPPKTNDNRPEPKASFNYRGPKLLKKLIRNAATLRNCSETEIFLSAMENEFGRMMVYGENFYEKWEPIISKQQARRFNPLLVVNQ